MMDIITSKYIKISEIYNLQDYEAAVLEEDPQYQSAQQILLGEITTISHNNIVKIIEIGGGSGIFTEKLPSNVPNASITVVEPDEEWFTALKARTSKFENINSKLDVIEDFTNSFYDICCTSFSLHHIPYDQQAKSVEKVWHLLRDRGHFIILDKFIPDFNDEYERQIGLKTYHGYFLSWKKQRNLMKGVEFEITSLMSNLLKTGDYKVSLSILEQECLVHFNLIKKIKIAPLKVEQETKKVIVENLVQAGFSVNKKEVIKIQQNLDLSNWGIFIYVLQKRYSPKLY